MGICNICYTNIFGVLSCTCMSFLRVALRRISHCNSYACRFWVSLPSSMLIKPKKGEGANGHINKKYRLVMFDKGINVKAEVFSTMTASLLALAKGKYN